MHITHNMSVWKAKGLQFKLETCAVSPVCASMIRSILCSKGRYCKKLYHKEKEIGRQKISHNFKQKSVIILIWPHFKCSSPLSLKMVEQRQQHSSTSIPPNAFSHHRQLSHSLSGKLAKWSLGVTHQVPVFHNASHQLHSDRNFPTHSDI